MAQHWCELTQQPNDTYLGFVFVADEGKPVVWRLSSDGTVTTEQTLSISGMGQVAKIRRDATSGFVLCSTAYASLGGADRNVMALVKLDNSLSVEWSQVTDPCLKSALPR